jgi:hypothetical protein
MCRVSILFGNGCNELGLNNDASQYFLAGSHNHEEEKKCESVPRRVNGGIIYGGINRRA